MPAQNRKAPAVADDVCLWLLGDRKSTIHVLVVLVVTLITLFLAGAGKSKLRYVSR